MHTLWFRVLSACVLMVGWSVPMASAQEETSPPQIDPYIALFGGVALPSTTDRRVDDLSANAHFTVLDGGYASSPSLGGKVGMWFPGLRPSTGLDFGLGIDVTNYQPDIKAGTRRATATVNGVTVTGTSSRAAETDINSTLVALNLLLRAPLFVSEAFPHGRLYPYLGGGIGFQSSKPPSGFASQLDPAFEGLAGLNVFLTRRVALFTEYKFTHAEQTFNFGTQNQTVTFNVSHVVAGLAFHFGS